MKKCNECLKIKPLETFYRDKANKTDGRYSICKACKSKHVDKWREANRAKYNADMRRYRSIHYKKLRLQRYKLTPEAHNQMLNIQGGTCALCPATESKSRPLAVDHDHKTGRVRGLLCYKCNRDIHILDNLEHLQKALEYLKP